MRIRTRRVLGRLLRLLTALCAAASLLIVALWVRSFWKGYETYWSDAEKDSSTPYVIHHRALQITCGRGGVRVAKDVETSDGWYASQVGGPEFDMTNEGWFDTESPTYPRPSMYWIPPEYRWAHAGFDIGAYKVGVGLSRGQIRWIVFPLWAPLLLTAVLPIAWAARHAAERTRRRRAARGLCLYCGYDLRASGNTCPECGKPSREAQTDGLAVGPR